MVKSRVHDLAAEFAVPVEQLMGMLREMNIFVRSHLSALEPDQVSAVRVRWEREKRKAAEAPAPKRSRRKVVEAAPPPAPADAKPVRRRRTAAEVAEHEAKAAALAEEEAANAPFDLEPLMHDAPVSEPVKPALSIEERARLLFKDVPPAPAEPVVEPPAPPQDRVAAADQASLAARPPIPPRVAPPSARPAAHTGVPPRPFIPPRVQRPAPGSSSGMPGNRGPSGPGGGRPRPVFSSSTPPPSRSGPPAPSGPPVRQFGPDAQPGGGRKKGKKGKKSFVDQDQVQANILKTLQGMKGGSARKKSRSDEPTYREIIASRAAEEKALEKTRIRVNEFISVSELADAMKVPANQIVAFAFKELGLMVTVNQRLDFDQIELIASEFGFQAVKEQEYHAEVEPEPTAEEGELAPRPPVVTIMGHVDHGKTSLLDYIRKANVVAGEAGGITQHIGAYHIALPGHKAITFLDTPGHQAFTAMRARGAQVTDIVVLVVAADDQVMPQTIEAISHARNAGVPLVVAINKIDLPSANVMKVKQDLLQQNVVLEEFGGKVLSAEISAKTGQGVPELLEQILLQAEILELKANPDAKPQGSVIESTLDAGKGPLATVLVQKGTLHVGDNFICGKYSGRVRALFDERGKQIKAVGPSMPIQVLGFDGVPSAGDTFLVVSDANEAREIAQKRQRLEREAQNRRSARGGTLEDISRALKEGAITQLRIIIKADQGGPAEALADALAQLGTSEVRVDIVLRGVGQISESDVLLAKASGAIILGFHVRPDANARAAAEREGVDIRTYRIIYEAVEDVKSALEGLLKPEEKETILGEAEVIELFKVSRVGTIAGSVVRSGVISRTSKVRVIRDGVAIYTGNLGSLKRFKDDAKEVKEGLECGIGIENFNDLKVGDRIESFRMEEVKRTLAASAAQG
ncbi:MAG: translation initiation factor IF-2 [Gemmatimonadales bacterium]